MHVNPESLDNELRLTIDAATAIANAAADDAVGDTRADVQHRPPLVDSVRAILVEHEFLRARTASDDDMVDLADRAVGLARLVQGLPESDLATVVDQVNHQLQSAAIAPTLSAHDGFPLHIHWTGATTPFSHQVIVDLLMALAQTLCDHGLDRFGRCAADGCEHVFFDATKNRSRRFCADPRCASRTHTAAHRSRRQTSTSSDTPSGA